MYGMALSFTIGNTHTECDPFGIPSTSHWTGAAIIVQDRGRRPASSRDGEHRRADALSLVG
jgi:hypothetical protein